MDTGSNTGFLGNLYVDSHASIFAPSTANLPRSRVNMNPVDVAVVVGLCSSTKSYSFIHLQIFLTSYKHRCQRWSQDGRPCLMCSFLYLSIYPQAVHPLTFEVQRLYTQHHWNSKKNYMCIWEIQSPSSYNNKIYSLRDTSIPNARLSKF